MEELPGYSENGIFDFSKDEILGYYNAAIQFAGDFELTGNFSLTGKRKYGVDHYTGTYNADYRHFSETEYLFGGTTIDREYGNSITISCCLETEEGTGEVFWISGSEEPTVLFSGDGDYTYVLTLPEGGNYIGIRGDVFTGRVEMEIK